ncbi:hypothetical protein [Speluncibacter jeojiensis]
MSDWTPQMQAWVDETLSRSRPLTVRQMDVIRAESRRAVQSERIAS